jgi:hypothetical protein
MEGEVGGWGRHQVPFVLSAPPRNQRGWPAEILDQPICLWRPGSYSPHLPRGLTVPQCLCGKG